ncbi:hypothetical protein [Acidovorax sp. 28-64-14]|uniref:hypothetical protein n=1 Tax=Acidovorax sp. 28-64-14 TaxID=1970310 RepID=UPI0025BB4574|nr:hypothetical protein [Acidovorax sp. 28-64-14]
MQFIVNFDADSTIPDLVKNKAEEEGITPEMLIKRAISGYLGTYGNVEPQEPQKATNLGACMVSRIGNRHATRSEIQAWPDSWLR